jgi:hypothetical protein
MNVCMYRMLCILLSENRDVVLNIVTRVRFLMRAEMLLFSTEPIVIWGFFPASVKRRGRKSDHSSPSSNDVKKVWSSTSTPQFVFTATSDTNKLRQQMITCCYCGSVLYISRDKFYPHVAFMLCAPIKVSQ